MNQLASPLARLLKVPTPAVTGPELIVLPLHALLSSPSSSGLSVCRDTLEFRLLALFAPRRRPLARTDALGFIPCFARRWLSSDSLASSDSDGRLHTGGRKYELACSSLDRSVGDSIPDAKLGSVGTGGSLDVDAFGVCGGERVERDGWDGESVVERGYSVDEEAEVE